MKVRMVLIVVDSNNLPVIDYEISCQDKRLDWEAAVWADRTNIDQAKVLLSNMPSGRVKIGIQAEGFHSFETHVELLPGIPQELRVVLEKK